MTDPEKLRDISGWFFPVIGAEARNDLLRIASRLEIADKVCEAAEACRDAGFIGCDAMDVPLAAWRKVKGAE